MTKMILPLSVVLLISVLLFSCGAGGKVTDKITENAMQKIAEKAVESAAAGEGEDLDVDFSGDQLTMTDDEGNTVRIGGGKLPDNWPASINIPSDMEIGYAGSSTEGSLHSWNFSGIYSGSAAELHTYFVDQLKSWTTDLDMALDGDAGNMFSYQAQNDSYQLSAMITSDDSGTALVLSVSEK